MELYFNYFVFLKKKKAQYRL